MRYSAEGEAIAVRLCAEFEMGPQGEAPGRVAPACVCLPAPDGRYNVRVRLSAAQDAPEAMLFASHRRLLWRGSLAAGETVEVSAPCAVHPHLPEGTDEPVPGEGIELALVAPGARIEAVEAEPVAAPALLLMGDSTVTDQPAVSPYAPGATYAGWGQMLPAHLCGDACVINFARSGMTVETFRTEGLYELLLSQVRPGDVVAMQFGHNDQKRPHLTADGGYAQAIRTYIAELRALGARPVLVTPLARNSWWNAGEYCDLLRSFARASRRVAREADVPLIDLHGFMIALLEKTGRDTAKDLFHTGDYTHTNDFGAFAAAAFVAGELDKLGIAKARACESWPPRAPYDALTANRIDEALPPTGLDMLYTGFETMRPDAPLTRIEALSLTCRAAGLFSTNERVPMPGDVPLAESWTDDVQCALQHRLIPADMLADGKLHPYRAISMEDFMRILSKGYGMRCPTQGLPKAGAGAVTRAQAAAICRRARI